MYPDPIIYGHITGYFSRDYGATGVEYQYNDELAAKTVKQQFGNLTDLFSPKDRTGDVTLTIDNDVQRAAAEGLLFKRGSVRFTFARNSMNKQRATGSRSRHAAELWTLNVIGMNFSPMPVLPSPITRFLRMCLGPGGFGKGRSVAPRSPIPNLTASHLTAIEAGRLRMYASSSSRSHGCSGRRRRHEWCR